MRAGALPRGSQRCQRQDRRALIICSAGVWPWAGGAGWLAPVSWPGREAGSSSAGRHWHVPRAVRGGPVTALSCSSYKGIDY